MTEITKRLAEALRLARSYMSDSIDYGSPCAKRDGDLVDEVLAAYRAQAGKASGEDAKDAERYRWLAEHENGDLYMENPGKESLDAAIDAAMEQST